jgi:8-oxo-dGTP pyrophosphatase MutT (NUDIX family)
VITDGPNVLLVRHTYGRRCWDLPGGKVERGEEPVTAGRREMLEELGLDISSWRWIAKLEVVADHRHDTLTCFHAEVAAPELTVELAEIAQTGWFQRFELPADLSPHAAVIIELLAA